MGTRLSSAPSKDDYIDGVHRVIKKARLYGFGVVDKPAYQTVVADEMR